MSYIKLKKDTFEHLNNIAKKNKKETKELAEEAINFYFAYLFHLKNEKEIISNLNSIKANLEKKEILTEEAKNALIKINENLAMFFFKEVTLLIKEIFALDKKLKKELKAIPKE